MKTENPSTAEIQKNPEKLSGRELCNYLLSAPETRGHFKWHTLRSCMWRDLLIAHPGFEDVADFQKIWHHDIYRILCVQPGLAPHFDFSKLCDSELRKIFKKYPDLMTPDTSSSLSTASWCEILKKHPHLSSMCSFKKFRRYDWINLLSGQVSFAEQCPWTRLIHYDWARLLESQNSCLKYLKLEHIFPEIFWLHIMSKCYLGEVLPYKGSFSYDLQDTAVFLILKRMDRINGKRFLKTQYKEENWKFIEELCSISPDEAMDVYKSKYMDFYITLMAPDSVFEKLFDRFDLSKRDSGGNSFLFPALLYSLNEDDMTRYELLLSKGLDPDEKNLAGFSCNDAALKLKEIQQMARDSKKRKEYQAKNGK